MANENHDPWALLREAREDVDAMGNGDLCRAIDRALAIHDAALAEAQDSAKDVVESVEMRWDWHEVNSPNRLAALLMDGTRVECHRANYNGVMGWSWNAMIQPVGFALTLEEAKSAAIAAARGMR